MEAYTDALAKQLVGRGVRVCAVVPGNFDTTIAANVVKRFAPPEGASEELRGLWAQGADTSRPSFPSPEAVAGACHAALFEPVPQERYLVTPNEEEAQRTLRQAAWELVRLNRSSPHRRSRAQLAALLDELDPIDAAGGAVTASA